VHQEEELFKDVVFLFKIANFISFRNSAEFSRRLVEIVKNLV